MADGVLAGVRVLDFGRYVAGPYCAAILGDLGAEVIRVERIGGGEDRYIYPVTEDGEGALFLQMNRNKRAMTLDVKAPGSAEILRGLVANSNVVIANLPSETLREMGLDYESLKEIRPDIILTALSAFGPSGPYAGNVGFDGVGQAMSGSAYLSGFDRPTKSFATWVDISTAMFGAIGTLAAIHEHARSGRGQLVQGNLLASALTVMNFPMIEQSLVAANRQATGNRGQSGGPMDFMQTKDGWIIVQILGDPLFRRWSRLIDESHWLDDARFKTDALRAQHGEILSARTAAWCAELTTADALARLAEARIPAGPVLSPQQVIDDVHVREAGFFLDMPYPGAPKAIPLVLQAFGLSQTPVRLSRRAPTLGEHTDEILDELGFTAAQIQTFRAGRVI